MIRAAQIRAGRGLVNMSQVELAEHAGIGLATLRRTENPEKDIRSSAQTLLRIQRALEAAGVIFIEQDDNLGPGVRLRARID